MAVLAVAFGVRGVGTDSAQASGTCTPEHAQSLIDEGRYDRAVREFTCLIEDDPTAVDGYRGRIEAQLLLGRFSDAVRDYARMTANAQSVHPDAMQTIHAGYAARLAADPDSIPALTGESFARWWDFDYPGAIRMLQDLLDLAPDDVYGNLFIGSSRALQKSTKPKGVEDLDRAIQLAPTNPHVRYVVSDACTYGLHDPVRALAEATLALDGGLDTPRVHAILGAAHNALGHTATAAYHVHRHFELVTTEVVVAPSLAVKSTLSADVVPGRTIEFPVPAEAGQLLSIATSSHDYWDTIAVLLAPDGTPLVGADDTNAYFAAFNWVAPAKATYRMRVTFFEGVISGQIDVKRN
jgi:tetratricopeptide (TPR) repeat protein